MQRHYSKKVLAGFFLLFIWSFSGQCQYPYVSNPFINPYSPGTNGFWLGMSDPFDQNQIAGEYLIVADHFDWANFTYGNEFQIAYKIESVSFPFAPDCMGSTCIGNQNRNLIAFSGIKNPFSLPGYSFANSVGFSLDDQLVIETPILFFRNGFVSQSAELVSTFYASGASIYQPIGIPSSGNIYAKINFPHTVLKQTLYLICSQSNNIIDSVSWVYDNTRGEMRYFPFCINKDMHGSVNGCYDVHFRPELIIDMNSPNSYESTDNNLLYTPNGGVGTTDYSMSQQVFQKSECNSSFIDVLPSVPATAVWGTGSYWGATHIPPYSILFGALLNCGGNSLAGYNYDGTVIPYDTVGISTGILHHYDIYSQDLSDINSKEKVIYNPSEASIVESLVFPSGYTFKTVYGIYPERPTVEQYNISHWNLYDHLSDAPAPIKSNENQSIYHVKAPLTIDPCVLINDAVFDVAGGSVTYDPDQTYGNFTFTGNLANVHEVQMPDCNCKLKCYEPSFYDEKDILINANTTWSPGQYDYINSSSISKTVANPNIRIAGTIEIAPNCTLALNPGCKLEFGHHGKIVVKPRGKLIINGTNGNEVVLTSACELIWDGIILEKFQGPPCVNCNINDYRSELVANHAIIENANIGVLSKGTTNYSAGKGKYPSGIIIANNCIFRNNIVDVQFNPYKRFVNLNPYAQGSSLSYCTFETTGRLLENTRVPKAADKKSPKYHIYLNNVHSVTLSNNTFRCTATDMASDERGTGIYSENSYVMTGDLYPNTFEGLTEGIWASHTGTPDYVRVRGNTFTNCIHSVVLEGTLNSLVVFNTFNIPEDDPTSDYAADETRRGYDKPVGLYLRECKGFRVEENVFNGPGTTPIDDDHVSFGIVANSIGGNDYPDIILPDFADGFGIIYRNIFNDNQIALQSELDNKGSGYNQSNSAGTGLFICCNEFNNSKISSIKIAGYDFNPTNLTLIKDGLLRDQGWTTNLTSIVVDNKFSGTPQNKDIDFNPNSQPFYYYYSALTHGGKNMLPTSDFTGFKFFPILINSVSYSCPSNYNGGATRSIAQIIKEIEQKNNTFAQVQDEYTSKVDGGNTNLLLNMIATQTPIEQIRNVLLDYSPFLSDDILGATIDPSNHVSPGVIKQILVANSPLTKQVLDTMINRIPALPSGVVNQIVNLQTGISERAKMESNMDYYAFEINMLHADLFRAGIEELKLDSVIFKLNSDTSKTNSVNMFPLYLAAGDAAKADSVFTVIKNLVVDTNSYEMTIQAINLRMLRDTITPSELDDYTLATTDLFISNNPEQTFKAKAIIKSAYGKKSKREPYSNTVVNNRSMGTATTTPSISSEFEFSIYPNPTSEIVNIKAFEKGNYEIKLYNHLGMAIASTEMNGLECSIDLKEVSSGVYQLLVFSNGNLLKVSKVIILKEIQ